MKAKASNVNKNLLHYTKYLQKLLVGLLTQTTSEGRHA